EPVLQAAGRADHDAPAASSPFDPVSGRVQPGCVAGEISLLPLAGTQHFLLQQRPVARGAARFDDAGGESWGGFATRSVSMAEPELCKTGPLLCRFCRRSAGGRGGEPCRPGTVLPKVCCRSRGNSLG